jgi:hypothetical protein
MFNWLKNLFNPKSTVSKEVNTFPFPTAKGQDQSGLAPYKVEPPAVVEPVKETVATAPKKPAAPKKKPAVGIKPAGTKGRKPKAKTVN